MSVPKTMFQLSGRGYAAANLGHATLVIIDAQKEYLSGPLALTGMDAAVANIKQLVAAARAAGRPIVHVRHLGTVGGLFDPQGERGEFIPGLEPLADETIIGKLLPSAFHGTPLYDRLQELGSLDLIVCGFMTHSSISTTVRATKDYGYRCTVVDAACATRDLPTPDGHVISAADMHRAEMIALGDNFAAVVPRASALI